MLSPEAKNAISANALQRNATKPAASSRRKSDVFSDGELDIIGAWGEAAAAAFCGAQYDDEIRRSGDDGVDFRVGGLAYAVKYNHRKSGYLMVEQRDGDSEVFLHDIEQVDVIISTTGLCLPPRECYCQRLMKPGNHVPVILQGWLFKDEFINRKTLKDWGLGGRWFVHAGRLDDIREIPALSNIGERL
jgi:hypothetical protein